MQLLQRLQLARNFFSSTAHGGRITARDFLEIFPRKKDRLLRLGDDILALTRFKVSVV